MPFLYQHRLNLLQNTLLELPLDLLSLVVRGRLAVQSHQATKVELGGLQQLNLADVDLENQSASKIPRRKNGSPHALSE